MKSEGRGALSLYDILKLGTNKWSILLKIIFFSVLAQFDFFGVFVPYDDPFRISDMPTTLFKSTETAKTQQTHSNETFQTVSQYLQSPRIPTAIEKYKICPLNNIFINEYVIGSQMLSTQNTNTTNEYILRGTVNGSTRGTPDVAKKSPVFWKLSISLSFPSNIFFK